MVNLRHECYLILSLINTSNESPNMGDHGTPETWYATKFKTHMIFGGAGRENKYLDLLGKFNSFIISFFIIMFN